MEENSSSQMGRFCSQWLLEIRFPCRDSEDSSDYSKLLLILMQLLLLKIISSFTVQLYQTTIWSFTNVFFWHVKCPGLSLGKAQCKSGSFFSQDQKWSLLLLLSWEVVEDNCVLINNNILLTNFDFFMCRTQYLIYPETQLSFLPPDALTKSQFPVFTMYASKICLAGTGMFNS